jgi:hypothetical protein
MDTKIYQTKMPLPEMRFQYSPIWKIIQSDGKGYNEITLLGPRNSEDTFSLAVVIRFTSLAQSINSIDAISSNIISKRMKLPSCVLDNQQDLMIDGIKGKIFEINFLSPKTLEKDHPDMMKILEKRLILIINDFLIEIIYTGTQDVYPNYLNEVNKLINSIKFLPNTR